MTASSTMTSTGSSNPPKKLPLVPPGERVILATRPSTLFVPLWPLGSLVAILVVSVGGAWLLQELADRVGRSDKALNASLRGWAAWLAVAGVAAIFLRLLWQVLEWYFRRYILTDRRVIRVAGVLRQRAADIPLENIQHLTLYRSFRERVTGLGTVGINTSGTGVTEAYWVMLRRPAEVLATIRTATEALRSRQAVPTAPAGQARPRPLVVGLAGGIGSGKSAVAQEFAKLGAVIADSDAISHQVLQSPEVRARLVDWWGRGVLTPEGAIDRRAVGKIVFADPAQRARLEALVHPLVRQARQGLIDRVAAGGAELVVIDAPLLFEAGVDRECDRVVFVDSPRDARLGRVKATRGWTERDLEAREKAQLPLEEKRARADDIIVNDADREALGPRVRDLLERIRRSGPRRPG